MSAGLQSEGYWLLLLGLLAFTICGAAAMAIVEPDLEQVQTAVKHGILSLIVLDAAVTVEVNSRYYAFWHLDAPDSQHALGQVGVFDVTLDSHS